MVFTQKDWLYWVLLICLAVVFSNGIHYVVFRIAGKTQVSTNRRSIGIRRHLARPARASLLIIGALFVLPLLPDIPMQIRERLQQITEILFILALGWLAIGGVYVFEAALLSRFDTNVPNNLRARRVHTQMQFVRRVLIGLVLVLDAGALLWSLHDERLWNYGTGLMASAGLASLILAVAAKSTASNLIAGLQIAMTEPIRIDDVVIVQGEWGRIEEVRSTYVVIKIWDERRLVVPLSYFIEQPFQNWTRTSADILGTAFLYVDYQVPVEPLRAELERVVRGSPLWDGRVCGLQVTNLSEHTMELRCLMSSRGSSENFDLRCLVREKMIEYLRQHYPQSLPTMRIEMARNAGASSEAGNQLPS